MTWKKLGLIFNPADYPNMWFQTHAALPITESVSQNVVRVYFSGRNSKNQAQIGYFHFDLSTLKVTYITRSPVVSVGDVGTFDDSGVTSSCLVIHEGRHYLYYSGWMLGVTVPFYFYIGLAVSDDGGLTYQKVSPAPIMGQHHVDPYLLGSPFVMVEDALWRMWYVSAVRWERIGESIRHYYLVKYAESHDGIQWTRTNRVCIPFISAEEYAIARPFVLKQDGLYKMWYAYRGEAYRIGYAESEDGLSWVRKDREAGIDVSEQGWDAEMIEYPYLHDHDNRRYMFYNGNAYGKTGIGLAVWYE